MNEQEKEQALRITHLWKELYDKGTYFEFHRLHFWERATETPNMSSDLSLWRVAEPDYIFNIKKIIDLSKCINTIDMEFYRLAIGWDVIGKLNTIVPNTDRPYLRICGGQFANDRCRIRQDHIHYYNGKGNPLPDGLSVKLYFNDKSPIKFKSQNINWNTLYGITGFEIIDTLPEYKYSWEQEE